MMFVPEIAPEPVPTYQPEGVFVPLAPMPSKFSLRLSLLIGISPAMEGLMARVAFALTTLLTELETSTA
jgi:hypothetical protein